MSRGISRRLVLGGLAGLAASPLSARAPEISPRPVPRPLGFDARAVVAVEDLLAEANLGGGKLGYLVADAASGETLESMNPLLALPPASVTKAVTSAYGLATLGPDFRFRTRLIATGPVSNGRLEGDLVLAGGGDPMLDTNDLAELASRLKQAGIREVVGRFLVHAGALPYQRVIDPGQPAQVGYNPAISGLNLNFNRVHFEWQKAQSGYRLSMDARSDKYRPEVSIARMRVVERDQPVYTYAQKGVRDDWTVARSALGEAGSRWLPVRRPDLYAAEVFQTLARAHGIRLKKAEEAVALPAGKEVAAIESARLEAVIRLMMKYSTNLTAEVIGLTTSQARGHHPATLAQSAGLMTDWMHSALGARHAVLHDHSGLSDASRISAHDMVRVLNRVGPGGTLASLMKELEPRDGRGKVDPTARHLIRAKTGSLNFVSSLAGYVIAPSGRVLTFAIFTGDLEKRAQIAPTDRERPEGARAWGRRSRILQHQLIERWVKLYDQA